MKGRLWGIVVLPLLVVAARGEGAPASAPAGHPSTLAVLPFIGGTASEKALAERMRFAVSQKLSKAADGGQRYARVDNVQVEQTLSSLQIPWEAAAGGFPAAEDIEKVISTLGSDYTMLGSVRGRTLTVEWYEGATLRKTVSIDIPSDKTSPKQAVEKLLAEATGARFAPLRQVEADHSDAAVEARFAERPNLVPDPSFEAAATRSQRNAPDWHLILGKKDEVVPLVSAEAAGHLAEDTAAIVPLSVAEPGAEGKGHCLMMRMSKGVAESNGLACISTWIPVKNGEKYRFAVKYLSRGPTARLFLKGFGYLPDQYGGKGDAEAARRQFYEAEVLSRGRNGKWETIEMDLTPNVLKATDPKIQWMRLDLYVYLTPGDVFFDEVVLKRIGG